MTTERELALATNVAAFDHMAERRLVNSSPHLKHRSLRQLHRAMIQEAADRTGRSPGEIAVLELGAGDGLGSIPWFELSVGHMVALDPSPVMLDRFARRASLYGVRPEVVCTEADTFLAGTPDQFDVVSFASVLHHIPDYLATVQAAVGAIRPGGSLVTFQDPLRYDTMPSLHNRARQGAYFAWRITQGNFRQGLRTRFRRLQRVYSASETADYEEYHVVRNGVDSETIIAALAPQFDFIRETRYWSTQSRLWQALGQHLGLKSEFGVLAAGRQDLRHG